MVLAPSVFTAPRSKLAMNNTCARAACRTQGCQPAGECVRKSAQDELAMAVHGRAMGLSWPSARRSRLASVWSCRRRAGSRNSARCPGGVGVSVATALFGTVNVLALAARRGGRWLHTHGKSIDGGV